MMSRVVMPWRISSTTASPDLREKPSRRRSTAGGAADPGSDIPMASAALAIVFAVYMPPQAPSPGQIARSMVSTSSRDMRPREHAPTASNASMMVTSFSVPSESLTKPGKIDPAYTKTEAKSSRAAAMSIPGSDLSQPANVTIPSRRSACITASTESAIISRLTSEKCIPSCPMEMPSDTEIVPNCMGNPPAEKTPSFAAMARRASERLQGVISFQLDAIPICGFGKSSSVIPTARSMPRAAVLSRPSVTSVLRGFILGGVEFCMD